jgi:hypothetical protein
MTTGSSSTPLTRKLGLKAGQAVAFVGLPDSLDALKEAAVFRRIETAQDWRALPEGGRDVILLFTTSATELRAALPVIGDMILSDGAIWVCWPKKASKVPTDLTDAVIRATAMTGVLVDVKVCFLDAVWSGLKLVVRVEARASHVNAGVAA